MRQTQKADAKHMQEPIVSSAAVSQPLRDEPGPAQFGHPLVEEEHLCSKIPNRNFPQYFQGNKYYKKFIFLTRDAGTKRRYSASYKNQVFDTLLSL